MSVPAYPEYKDSGVEWLGKVPSHWTVKRLRFLAQMNPSKTEVAELDPATEVSFLPMEAVGDDGALDLERTRPIQDLETGYTYFRDGDVVFAKITPCFENGKGAIMQGLTRGVGFGTTELIVARPRQGQAVASYLHWLFSSVPFRKLGEATMYGAGGQKRVPEAFVRDFPLGVPPISEQAAIAAFLDRETGKIDALVAEQEKLIELLKEKRQAVISHAVIKGLNPSVPMKDSGVEWLGNVPEHWNLRKLKAMFCLVKRQDQDEAEVLSVYRDYGVILKSSRDDNFNKTPEDLSLYQTVRPNDLVINKMKAWQGSLGISSYYGITSPDYVVFQPIHQENSRYLHYLLRSQGMPGIYQMISNGIRPNQWRLEPDKFVQLTIPLPPTSEQIAISEILDEEANRSGNLIAEAQRAIDLLKERRSALISAAVTGKIDVRGLVATEAAEAA